MLSGKMPIFDAAVNTMGSISTGGLVVHPAGIIHYDSLYVEIVISVFCILSSVNFVLYHYLITGKPGYLFKDIELRVYLCIIAIAVCICTASLVFVDGLAPGSALRESFFQVVSMATTTGYVRDTSILWPATCQIIMIALLFIGGCSASTAGSIKVVRIIVMMKLIWRGCIKRIHPRSVVAVKLGGSSMSVSLVTGITTFIFTYLGVFFISAVVLSLQGLDMETTFTTTLAVQYGDRIRRNIIHHQFLLLPPTAEAVSQRTDDNRQAGAFHDPDPVHQELLGQSALSRTAPQILCRKLRRKSCIKLQKLHILTA